MTARTALREYFEIIDRSRDAKYLCAKKTHVDFDLNAAEEILWKVHSEFFAESHKCKIENKPQENSLFDLKLELARRILGKCIFCERRCLANRLEGEMGHCRVLGSKITTEFIHWGEEPELVPSYTIFFSSCTFHCVFCQNWDISQEPDSGIFISPEKLAKLIEGRERKHEARNVNFVGGEPTPNLTYILEVLKFCNANLPMVWNSNMYMSAETVALLEGIVDLYLSDFKYGNDKCAKRLSNVERYFEIVSRNHKIANQQCEMIIRHLVMPNHVECCSKPVLDWIAENLNLKNIRVNVMAQYRPEYKAHLYGDINRRLTTKEFETAFEYAERLGLDIVE